MSRDHLNLEQRHYFPVARDPYLMTAGHFPPNLYS
jgi:hypothetical protein